jgi:hypothetical protein
MFQMDLEAATRQAEQKLMSKPNVNGVGIGQRDGKPVIQVFVTRKLPKSELRAHEIVPETVAGYPTQVVEIGEISTQLKPD